LQGKRPGTISERIKDALAAAKARGFRLGGRRTTPERHAEISRLAREVRSRKRERWERNLRPVIDQIRASGARTLREIAEELNRRDEVTRWGCTWTATQVSRILKNTIETA
jgi:DNA invertase Pin-like site-specific DNA recombinase